jgi:tetratricopeptide (TPR) repeat protein
MDARAERRSWADTWLAPAALAVATALVFARGLGGAFVADDHVAVLDLASRRPEFWAEYFTRPSSLDPFGFVRPLRLVDLAIDRAWFGADPFAFHVHSLLWHVAAAVLLLLVLRRLVGNGLAALAGATFWSLHVAHVESVAWVSGRSETAMGACAFAAVLFALRSRGLDRDLGVSLVAAAAAMLFKETALALPLVVAFLRLTGFSRARMWPYVAAAGACLVYRLAVPGSSPGDPTLLTADDLGALATVPRELAFFVPETLLPAQAFDWRLVPARSFAEGAVVAGLVLHAALLASAVRARRRAPLWTLSVAWFYAFLLPVAAAWTYGLLLPVAEWRVFLGVLTSERYLYAPLAGAAIAFAWAFARGGRPLRAAAAVVVVSLAAQSVVRCGMWRDDAALFGAARADHASPLALQYFAEDSRTRGFDEWLSASKLPKGPERDAAQAQARRTLEESLDTLHELLRVLARFASADGRSGKMPRRAETNASNVAWFLGRDDEALCHAERAVRLDPVDPRGHYDRALPLLRLGFAPQAIAAMRRAAAMWTDGDQEIGEFFAAAAAACARDGLVEHALAGYADAVRVLPDGAARESARRSLAAVSARAVSGDAAALERARIAELDAALARRPRACPAD